MRMTALPAAAEAGTMEVTAEQEGAYVELSVNSATASLTPDQAEHLAKELIQIAKEASTYAE